MTAEERAYNYASTQKLTKLQVGEIAKHYNNGYQQALKDFMEKACKFLDDRISIYQEIEVNENGEPLASSYIAYCEARKQEAEKVINSFKNYMQDE